ncbi:hypothetical protein JW879_07575 [candidate division WOR-3 bacterium]|nr:hypothetical protein [candidate division WOR-3 bacterium]
MFLFLLALFEGEFILVGVDAGSWGRGSTGIAYPTTGFKNPASSLVLEPCVYFTGSRMFGNLANVLSGGLNLRQSDYGFGVHFVFHSVGDIYDTRGTWDDIDGDGYPDPGEELYDDFNGVFSSREGAIFSTYSKWVGNISLGLGLKFIYREIYETSAVGAGADLGIIYQLEEISIGVAIKDITTSPVFWEDSADHIAPSYQIGFGFNKRLGKVPVLMEVNLIQDEYGFNNHLGVEIGMNEWLKARAGFFNKQVTTGFGIEKRPFLVDYALNIHPDLLMSHRVSLLYKL